MLPDRVAAGHHGAYNTYTFFGTHPATGERYQQFDLAQGGWGGARHRDGFSPLKTLTHGDTQDIPVEVLESLYPLRVERYALRPDSAGPGHLARRSGHGAAVPHAGALRMNVNFDRTQCPPWGLFGGGSATSGGAEIVARAGAGRRGSRRRPTCAGGGAPRRPCARAGAAATATRGRAIRRWSSGTFNSAT